MTNPKIYFTCILTASKVAFLITVYITQFFFFFAMILLICRFK
jgi:hypothetical protein